MSISYNVVPNALTNPPSFTTRVAPNLVLDFDEMAVQINLHNPTIPVATAKSVMESFREEVKTQLLNGNTVKLTNFVSFVPTIPVNLASATDPLPSSPLDIKAKPSATFKTECNQAASYTRLGYPTKDPSIIEAKDTNTSILGFIEAGKGFRIDGRNIGFDVADSELGVYLVDSTAAETKQTNITINDPSMIAITPAFTPVGPSYSELTLLVKNRYTTNGTLRTGTYQRKLRGVVTVDTGNLNEIFCVGDAASLCEVTSFNADNVRAVFALYLDQGNVLNMKVRSISGTWGAVQQITEEIAYSFTIGGLSAEVTIGSLANLTANVTAYGRYMEEVVDLNDINP